MVWLGFGHFVFFGAVCLSPSASGRNPSSGLEGRVEACICESTGGMRAKGTDRDAVEKKQGKAAGIGTECPARSSVSPSSPQSIPIPPIHTRLSIYQDKASRCPCNREASASLPSGLLDSPFPWQAILCSHGIQFRNSSSYWVLVLPCLSCLFFSFPPMN